MTGGESAVSTADTDALLLDFMRVIRAQHHLHSSDELGLVSNKVWLNVGASAPLFESLGLKPQPPEVQWMLIVKLFRELYIDEIAGMYKDGTPLNQDKLMHDYSIEYSTLDDEVMIDVLSLPFKTVDERLKASSDIATPPPDRRYSVRLWVDDNKLMLHINDVGFEVGRLNDDNDSMIGKLITKLLSLPQGRILNAIEFAPNRGKLNFKQEIKKNRYGWMMPMFSVAEPRRIALKNPSEFSQDDMRELVTQINAKYRKQIQEHLGFTD